MNAKERAPGPWQGARAPHTETSVDSSLTPSRPGRKRLPGLPEEGAERSFIVQRDNPGVNPLEEIAVGYVRRGWALLPISPRDKTPYVELLPRDRTGAPSWGLLALRPATEAEVRAWFRHDPACNVAIICGEPSGGLIAVDVDRQPAGRLHLPPTATVATARGAHYYYRSSKPVPSVSCSWGEIRGDGSYVVAAGSTHPNGIQYRWCDYCDPDQIELADLPADLLEAAEEDRERLQKARGQVSKEKYTSSCLPKSTGAAEKWFVSEEAAVRILKACGVLNPRVGKAFRCPLPGHDDRRPSAALWRQEDGSFGLHDFHQCDGHAWYSLPEVFASVHSGKTVKLGPGEQAAWMLRAVVEVGLLKAPTLMAPRLPADAPKIVQDVYAGFRLLLAVRSLYDPDQDAAPFQLEVCRYLVRPVRTALRRGGSVALAAQVPAAKDSNGRRRRETKSGPTDPGAGRGG